MLCDLAAMYQGNRYFLISTLVKTSLAGRCKRRIATLGFLATAFICCCEAHAVCPSFPDVAVTSVSSAIRCESGRVSKCPCIMYLIMGQIRMTATKLRVRALTRVRAHGKTKTPETIQYFSPGLTNAEGKFVAEITAKDARYAANSRKLRLLNRINSQSSVGAREQYIIINEFRAGRKIPTSLARPAKERREKKNGTIRRSRALSPVFTRVSRRINARWNHPALVELQLQL